MSHTDVAGRARELLDAHLTQLGELRNASTRDPSFKQWRQATLTLLQRLWPGDPARSERFRRVPFTAPTGRPDARTTREFFERGCAEAASCLKELLAEVAAVGIAENQVVPERAGLPSGTREDDFPTVSLPGDPEPRASAPTPPCAVPALSPAAEPGPTPARPGRGAKKNGSRMRLKDMLGFGDLPATPADARAHQDELPAQPAVRPDDGPGEDESGTFEQATQEMLRTSPVLKSTARPLRRAGREILMTPTPASVALATLAAAVEDLGIPEGHRARVRAALLDLARQIEARELTWVALREAMSFMMEYPELGRRVLPLLVPFLDQAA